MESTIHRLLISFCIAQLIISLYLFAKSVNTGHQRMKIMNALFVYNVENLHSDEGSLLFTEMEPYISTLLRWWDWGCKRIVSRDVYSRIEPYIGLMDPLWE